MRALKHGITVAALGGFAAVVFVSAGRARESLTIQSTRDCSHDYIREQVRAFTSRRLQLLTAFGFTTASEPIPESPLFHDCQKFVVDSAGSRVYTGGVFTVLANLPDAEVAKLHNAKIELTESEVAGLSETAKSKDKFEKLVGKNYSWMAGIQAGNNYPALGLQQGWNCLLGFPFKIKNDTTQRWFAAMAPRCEFGNEVVTLEAKPSQPGGFTDATYHYPDAARWDWDDSRSEQYIGVGCGAAWCEIGKRGFIPSEPAPLQGTKTSGERKVRLIKGWHDRQYLAQWKDNQLVPSNVMGILVPDPQLVDQTNDDFDDRVLVANVYLFAKSDDDPVLEKYKEKLNFGMRNVEKPNKVFIRAMGRKGPDDWEQRIWRDRLGTDKNVDFRIKQHPAVESIGGLVRWRWSDRDEGTWIRCAAGCCELEG